MTKFFALICISLLAQSPLYSSEHLIIPGASYYTLEDQNNSNSDYHFANYYTATGDFIVKARVLKHQEFEKLDPAADKPQPTTFAIRHFPQKSPRLYEDELYRVIFFDKHGNKINPNLHPIMPEVVGSEKETTQPTEFYEFDEFSRPSYWQKNRWLSEKISYAEEGEGKREVSDHTLRIEGFDLDKALNVPLENTYQGVLIEFMGKALAGQGVPDIFGFKEHLESSIVVDNFFFDPDMIEDYFDVFDQVIDTAENSLAIPKFCINNLNHPLCKEYYACLANWIIADGLNNKLKENKKLLKGFKASNVKESAQRLRNLISRMKREMPLLKFDVKLEFEKTLKLFGSLKETEPSRTIRTPYLEAEIKKFNAYTKRLQ